MTPVLSVTQAGGEGPELLRRFAAAVGAGDASIYRRTAARGRSPYAKIQLTGRKRVEEALRRCRPWLSRTKIEQAERALTLHQQRRDAYVHPMSRKTHCPRNHPYDAANTYYKGDGRRRCRACRMARYYEQKAARVEVKQDEEQERREGASEVAGGDDPRDLAG